jgi:hypothetical protein
MVRRQIEESDDSDDDVVVLSKKVKRTPESSASASSSTLNISTRSDRVSVDSSSKQNFIGLSHSDKLRKKAKTQRRKSLNELRRRSQEGFKSALQSSSSESDSNDSDS